MAAPLTQSDLIFPAQSLSISSTLSSLKRAALSTNNRLTSITSDSDFVVAVSEAYGLPLVANERCGSWYIPPEKKVENVYFKSTDGHTNEWSFSLRRLNLQLLDVVERFGGCVIVDSTRRGKSMPDALVKTIPIWCYVMNRALFPDLGLPELYTPPQAVSASEHAQIESRIDRFVDDFLDICKPNLTQLRAKVSKPLRPIWVTPTTNLPSDTLMYEQFHPIVLCTASRRVHGAEGSEGGYIQGAADDHEAWSQGLTPALFWSHKSQLLGTNEEDLPALIHKLLKEKAATGADAAPILIKPTKNLFVSKMQNLDIAPFDAIINCAPDSLIINKEHHKTTKHLHLRCQLGKLGSRDLRAQLARIPAFFSTLPDPLGKILVCCPTGKDLSVGVALALLCMYADDADMIGVRQTGKKIDKRMIKQRLSWLTTTSPTLNPPRGTLQSVNAFLMPDPSALAPNPPILYSHPAPAETKPPTSTKSVLQNPEPTLSLNTAAILTSLHNTSKPWIFTRKLTSALPTHPSGTVEGTAAFTPHASPTPSAQETLLYAEEGAFITTTGLRFTARRKYVYQLQPALSDAEDTFVAVHFAEDEKGNEGIGGMFVEMGELVRGGDGVVTATNREQHLCGEDLYTASWRFGSGMLGGIQGDAADAWWEVRYIVKGPKKDYVSETRYTRA